MTLAVIFFVLFLGNLCNGFLQNKSSDNICVQNGLLCPAVDGPDSIYKPLPDCTKFCQCTNGVPYLHTCPLGLEFNPTLNVCDWPEDAGCTGGAAASDDTRQNPTEETTARGSTTTVASGDDICVQNNIVCPAVDGPDSVYKPLPDCTKFCQCSNGVPYSHTCPFGLEFNPTLNVCDWPEDAGCTGGAAASDDTRQNPTEETTARGSTTTAASGDDICVQNNIVCPAVDGPDSVYKPLPDCTKFCQCSNGVPYSHTCSFGLEFNPTLNVCDWPEDAGCTGGAATSDQTTQSTTEKTTAQGSNTTAASGDDICVQNNIVCPAVDGPDSVYKPLPDCTKFCQCSNGVPYSHTCPFGLEFNPTLNVCDWPEDAGCTGGAATSDETTQSPTEETTAQGSTTTAASGDDICVQNNIVCPSVDGPDSVYKPLPDCTKFCQCSNGVPYLHSCPFGLEFNPTLNVCDWPEDAGCTGGAATSDETTQSPTEETTAQGSTTTAASGDDICVQNNIVCPAVDGLDSVYKPLPDCTKFCQCSNGVPYSHTCPFGLEFNPTLNVCDWPEDAGCTGGAATSDETTQSPTEETTAQGSTTTAASGDDICVQNNIVCPAVDGLDSVYKPLPDCTKFCQCSNGVPYSHTCPFGLEFNPTLNVCDWPEDAGCTGGAATSDETTQSPTEETTAQGSTTDETTSSSTNKDVTESSTENSTPEELTSAGKTENSSSTTDSPNSDVTETTEVTTKNIPSIDAICLQSSIVCPEVDGPDSVYGALPDCSRFCQCSNGVPYLHFCPTGLLFNPILNVCDWPENAGCVGGDSTTTGSATTSYSSTEIPITEKTASQSSTSTASNSNGLCLQSSIVCPAFDGLDSIYGALLDCTKFCQCSNGVPYLHTCPAGLNFNPSLNVCDWPQNAGCAAA